MIAMRFLLLAPLLLTAALTGCAAKAQVRNEVEVPLLDPPPPPPRVVVTYPEPEPPPEPVPIEASLPAKPAPRPPRPEQKAEPVEAPPEPPVVAPRPVSPAALTLTPIPGSEAQTVTAIRALMDRASRDLQRVNASALNHDGRAQLDQARRFLQQADEALKVRNIVFAGRLADKAATMAAILVR
jgi:outer membrane biosynthesis protein TonB